MKVELVIEQHQKEIARQLVEWENHNDADIPETDTLTTQLLREKKMETGYYDLYVVSPHSEKSPGLHGDFHEGDLHDHIIRIA